METDYCLLLALPCGRDQEDVVSQTESLKAAFITYLQAKQAAGIINVPNPGSNQVSLVPMSCLSAHTGGAGQSDWTGGVGHQCQLEQFWSFLEVVGIRHSGWRKQAECMGGATTACPGDSQGTAEATEVLL